MISLPTSVISSYKNISQVVKVNFIIVLLYPSSWLND